MQKDAATSLKEMLGHGRLVCFYQHGINAHQQPLDLAELSEIKLGLQERTYHGDLKSGIHSQQYLFLSWDLFPTHLTQGREHLGKLGYKSLVPPG